jgi:hypothetical protein
MRTDEGLEDAIGRLELFISYKSFHARVPRYVQTAVKAAMHLKYDYGGDKHITDGGGGKP